jgi:hypothetical protein
MNVKVGNFKVSLSEEKWNSAYLLLIISNVLKNKTKDLYIILDDFSSSPGCPVGKDLRCDNIGLLIQGTNHVHNIFGMEVFGWLGPRTIRELSINEK